MEELIGHGVLKTAIPNKDKIVTIPISKYFHSYSKYQIKNISRDSVLSTSVDLPVIHVRGKTKKKKKKFTLFIFIFFFSFFFFFTLSKKKKKALLVMLDLVKASI